MLKLIIDIGNTNSKLALFDKNTLIAKKILERIFVKDIIAFTTNHSSQIKSAIVCSVVTYPKEIIEFLKNNYFIIEFSYNTPLPIVNLYETPETLGKDRIAGVVGAFHTFPDKNTLVIDCGTCITYDFISNTNKYLGGSISCGLDMRFKALHKFTEKLPLISKKEIQPQFKKFIGRNTKNSILSGVINGVIAEIDGTIEKYKENFSDLKVILGGGNSTFLHKKLKNKVFLSPDNILLGLNVILEHNIKQAQNPKHSRRWRG